MSELARIETAAAQIYPWCPPSPQYCWPLLCARAGTEVWVKHENHGPIGAFKLRGGLVYMRDLAARHPDPPGVITATRGNHGQSVAFAARAEGVKALVVVPRNNSEDKNRAMAALGAELVEHGDDFNSAHDHARDRAEASGLHWVPSFHPLLVRGVASYSLEFLNAIQDLDTVYVPIGLGSGISGMIAVRDGLNLRTKIVGVVADRAAAYALSFEARAPVATNSADTLADGVAVRVPDPEALEIILGGAERVVTVAEAEIEAAVGFYFTDTHNIAEGAGAVPLAALLKEKGKMAGKKVGLILTGGNLDARLYRRILGQI